MMFAHLTLDACVAASGRSLTHPQVRSLTSSAAPSPRIVIRANPIL
jgi:hypothetical protein